MPGRCGRSGSCSTECGARNVAGDKFGLVLAVTLYRYHPDTGADAADLDVSELQWFDADAKVQEHQYRVQGGALFYWFREIDGHIRRVELRAYLGLTDATGGTLTLDHTPRL